MNIHNRLKELRTSLGLTQKDISIKLGVKPSYYSDLENENRTITGKFIEKLKNSFNVSADWMYNGEGAMVTENINLIVNNNAPNNLLNSVHHLKGTLKLQKSEVSKTTLDKSKEIIFERKFAEYLKANPDIQTLNDAAFELLSFEFILSEVSKKYLQNLLLIADTRGNGFEFVKENYYKYIEDLRPFSKPFINLATAIKTFNKEMYEAGDKWFDFAENS